MVARRFKVLVEWDSEDQVWVTYVPVLDHLSTFGETREEALENTRGDPEMDLMLLSRTAPPSSTAQYRAGARARALASLTSVGADATDPRGD